ncbi:DUF2029 domain-containing protein [Burkholderia pseudomultivorans]|uniref:DUF2029 domain-containing protein n=2 Tax=Burkholderia cepacia complex TaxID=87882 RepID=A0AAN0RMD7_9BURK|nr:glycosyltransferase family 87 protein [Burkholderia pseudomultivorans]AIO30402.1 hypothetical protein DM39_7074 [Burkholderia cenocepacia]AOI90332.1 hypothetical protein WS57_15750 [Burkholderia pseudomultivorans]KVC24406.1 hypothetical protein WS55_18335 [Burkholderia pseudomultivorans]KVC34124.1 hypothetical protein WS56_12545 [Burkholderia pseudomultivorans]KVC48508.1 hypothetical protein WS58_08780 [Burkholderia pseudomultivorans]
MKAHHPARPGHPVVAPHPALPVAGPRRRPHWLTGARVRLYAGGVLLTELLFVGIYVARVILHHAGAPEPLAQDFSPVWSAARLAAHGHALDAWRFPALFAVQKLAIPTMNPADGILPWLYPPSMLLFVLPLGWLPYALAAVLWLGATYALFAATVRGIARHALALPCALAFPGAFLTVVGGQTSLLTASLAGLGLLLLRRRPIAAGVCLGLLTMKPQLSILFPLALLCAGQSRALAAWAATIACVVALSALAFGTGTWIAFAHGVHDAYQIVLTGQAKLSRMPTVFAMATLAGWPAAVARALQLLSAAGAALAVLYTWRANGSYALRAATVTCACLLVSPYLYDYDLTWYGIVIAWYARHAGEHGWRRFDREWLALMWAMPLGGFLLVPYLSFQLMPIVTLASLVLLVARVARERRDAPVLPDAGDDPDEIDFTRPFRTRRRAVPAPRRDEHPLPRGHHH